LKRSSGCTSNSWPSTPSPKIDTFHMGPSDPRLTCCNKVHLTSCRFCGRPLSGRILQVLRFCNSDQPSFLIVNSDSTLL
jgi:hypothetical protein